MTIQELFKKIKENRGKTVVFLAPIFNDENITDGYWQRIKAIDETFFKGYLRIYLRMQEDYMRGDIPAFELLKVDERHVEVFLDSRSQVQSHVLFKLIVSVGLVYVHCAARVILRSTGVMLRKALKAPNVFLIWDVHGSVPEEYVMQGDFWGEQEADEAESFLAAWSDLHISVNFAMEEHLRIKYGRKLHGKSVILPIFTSGLGKEITSIPGTMESTVSEDSTAEKSGRKALGMSADQHKVVYAGGLQSWQKAGRMVLSISRCGDRCSYQICVSKPDEFLRIFDTLQVSKPSSMEVAEKTPEELKKVYQQCQYGFVLRDDTVVNQVACPTKLIEYIEYGILPIMDSPNIGDFKKLGLQYLSVSDFDAGKLPKETERVRMVKENRMVLIKLLTQHETGVQQLKEALAGLEGRPVQRISHAGEKMIHQVKIHYFPRKDNNYAVFARTTEDAKKAVNKKDASHGIKYILHSAEALH